MQSEHALLSVLGNQWEPMIQGLASVCVCVYVCLGQSYTRNLNKKLCQ
jgi:hypothetical protein